MAFAKTSNRRADPRGGREQAGEVLLEAGARLEPCVIFDLSTRGARLRFSRPILLPKTFDLRFVNGLHRTRVRMAWRRGSTVGIEFETPLKGELSKTPDALAFLFGSLGRAALSGGVLVLVVTGLLFAIDGRSSGSINPEIEIEASLRGSV